MKPYHFAEIQIGDLYGLLDNMTVDTTIAFMLQKHGYITKFRVIRTADGWREQNDLYGMVDGMYGIVFASADDMVGEINSILDK